MKTSKFLSKQTIVLLPKLSNFYLCFFLLIFSFLSFQAKANFESGDLPSLNIKSPIFIQNLGQLVDEKGDPMPEVLYYARTKGVDLFFTKTGLQVVQTLVKEVINDSAVHEQDKFFRFVEAKKQRTDIQFESFNALTCKSSA